MKKVKDHTIGMGLACSKEICNNLGGDLMLVSSEPGFTQFSFKLPVLVRKKSRKESLKSMKDIMDLKKFTVSVQDK